MKQGKRISGLSIRQKVQYIFVTAILLCVIISLMFFYFYMQRRMSDSAEEKSTSNLSLISRNFESVVNNVNNISKLIMVNDTVMTYLKSDNVNSLYYTTARGEIYDMLNSFSERLSVFIFRTDQSYIYTGIGIISADKSTVFSDEWVGKVMDKNGGYIIMPNNGAFSFNTDTDVISFVRVINDLDTQKPIGLLVINIPIEEIKQTYEDVSDEDTHFAFFDSNGDIICSDKPEEFEGAKVTENGVIFPANKRTIREKEVISTYEDAGVTIASKAVNRVFEGTAAAGAPIYLVGLAVLVIVMLILINAYISRSIIRPISQLVDSMMEADKGLLRRVSMQADNDEIGKLKDTYNHMLVQINRLIDEVIQEEKNCRTAEMGALQEQIKPHFLYNTLDTIAYMSLQNPPEEVYDAIETLGNFYRRFLSKGKHAIPLSDEISIVRDYIKLQRLRYDNMFDDEYSIADGVGEIPVPKLILQPLVENCIYHGIRPKGEHCTIRITAYTENGSLIIKVYDNGIGMTEEEKEKLLQGTNTKSFGFKGTIDRIKYYCRSDDVAVINTSEGEYCEIVLTIPLENIGSERRETRVQGDDN